MSGTVTIDCFPESADRYKPGHAIVAIDVIRATTTATTAVSLRRRVFPARSSDEAAVRAAGLPGALLVGELGGNKPVGFDITNSPAEIARRTDVHRPMVFVSSSGTQLILNAAGGDAVYLACLRNYSAVARHVAANHESVAVIGAGTRGQFRREDQIGCAMVASALVDMGFVAQTQRTVDCIARWREASREVIETAIRGGRSAAYLVSSGQHEDLEFVLAHFDDLDAVPNLVDGEVLDLTAGAAALKNAGVASVAVTTT